MTIRGHDIVVDFQGAVWRGTTQATPPDERRGLAILIDGGTNITLKNAHLHGYKLAILARNVQNLKLVNCDWSYNWKQRLKSTRDKEDESDWMSFHQNDHVEWIKGDPPFGAGGAYLSGCIGFSVEGCRNTGSQCGLMLDRCANGKVFSNDFSFLSAIGIGLYRSSDNKIENNSIDFCVRGYSHGIYSRGQDSAAILVYEQSNRNVFAYNTATHSGDGFFLWAGQTTMDTGKGGCNDNLVFGNDFSHAPTNGIEATFSRNTFACNRVVECWHGVWGGYSYDSKWIGNTFRVCGQAFAIEHGQKNQIERNYIVDCDDGIALWANPNADPNWGYPKRRDTRSRDYEITRNTFSRSTQADLSIANTANAAVELNDSHDSKRFLTLQGVNPNIKIVANKLAGVQENGIPDAMESANPRSAHASSPAVSLRRWMRGDGSNETENDPSLNPVAFLTIPLLPVPGPSAGSAPAVDVALDNAVAQFTPKRLGPNPNSFKADSRLEKGRRYILVDEWGPYDFRSPILWPRGESQGPLGTVKHFEIIGPKGTWTLGESQGAEWTSAKEGSVGGWFDVRIAPGKAVDLDIELQYRGGEVTTPWGKRIPAGEVYTFGYKAFFLPIDWHVRWYKWDKSDDPRVLGGWETILAGPVIKQSATDKLDYAGYGAFAPGLPPEHYATAAEGEFECPAGEYKLELTTDDGARAWVDGTPVITNAWHYQGPTGYSATLHLAQGKHTIKVDHFQIDGYAALQVKLTKA